MFSYLGKAWEVVYGQHQSILRLQEEQLEALLIQMTNAMDDITSEANRDGSSIGCSRCGQYLLGRFSTRWQKDGQTIGPISITLGIL